MKIESIILHHIAIWACRNKSQQKLLPNNWQASLFS
jgi:hypothetical protein